LAKDTAVAREQRGDVPGWGGDAVVVFGAWLMLAAGFLTLAMHAASGHVARTDLRLLNAAQHLPSALDPWVRLQTALGEPQTLGACVVMLAGVLLVRGARVEMVVALSAFGMFALTVLIKHIVQEVPPGLAQPAEYEGVFESNYSFPSGHVVGLTVLGGLVVAFAGRITSDALFAWMLRFAGLISVVSVGPGRIYLGVHYPSDVVAAYLLSLLFLLPVLFVYWQRRRGLDLDGSP
jgi:undecaprenyl-diphosphatase